MPRMLLSYALLCFALASSFATPTDDHTGPVIANGTNQDPRAQALPVTEEVRPNQGNYQHNLPQAHGGFYHNQGNYLHGGFHNPGNNPGNNLPGFYNNPGNNIPGGYCNPGNNLHGGFYHNPGNNLPGGSYCNLGNYPRGGLNPNPGNNRGGFNHNQGKNRRKFTYEPANLRVSYDRTQLKTVDKIQDLIPGHLYYIRRNELGIDFYSRNNAPVIYIGPVPLFKQLAFVLVLDKVREPGLLKHYTIKKIKECFGKTVPSGFEGETEVAVNFDWAQVAIAERLDPDQKHLQGEKVILSDSMLNKVKLEMDKNYKERCKSGLVWNWERADLGQDRLTIQVTDPNRFFYNGYNGAEYK